MGLSLTWGLLLLSQPGLFDRDGYGALAFFALIPWAYCASRPGPWARTIEWACATVGLCGFAFWMRYLLPWAVFPMGAVPALYVVLAGGLLRRGSRRWPLALVAPFAWLTGEVLRFTLDAPLSFGWWRLGTLAHAHTWFAEGARFFGVWGLSFAMAAWAGWWADRLRVGTYVGMGWLSHGMGWGTPLAVVLAGQLVSPPAMEAGPRVLVVTPGLSQALKQSSQDPWHTRVIDPVQAGVNALRRDAEAGEPTPDLIAFGETMLYGMSVQPEVWPALQAGRNAPEYTGRQWSAAGLRGEQDALDFSIGLMQGRVRPNQALTSRYSEPWLEDAAAGKPPWPAGSSFFSGVEAMVVREGHLWRMNATQIWSPDGTPTQPASKVHLVPAAENPYPAAYLPWLLSIIQSVGGYIPDLVTDGEAGVLPFTARDGRAYRVGSLICYDNSYDDPFLTVHRDEGIDFHLVASNEAWYRESVLMDHMLAFTRLGAIQSGRAVLRATNSGASALVGPRGRILALLKQEGRHKMVRGGLAVTVPVPKRGGGGVRIPSKNPLCAHPVGPGGLVLGPSCFGPVRHPQGEKGSGKGR